MISFINRETCCWRPIPNNLGNVAKEKGRLDEAVTFYQKALQLRPDLASAHANLLTCWNYHPAMEPQTLYREHCRWAELHVKGAVEAQVPASTSERARAATSATSPALS